MGGICSRRSNKASSAYLYANGHHGGSNYVKDSSNSVRSKMIPPQVREKMEKEPKEPEKSKESSVMGTGDDVTRVNQQHDDFYDGIPRYTTDDLSRKSRSTSTTHAAVAKVSEVSLRLGRAGTVGLEKAVEVLDTLGSSMTNLNPNSGFAAGVASKGNELAILAFEVANTIVKGSSLMQSLSKISIQHLKEKVLPSEGVQNLVSKDMDELLRIFVADKREELKIFSGEVVRFGNRSKDPQWHNLERYFEKISREINPEMQLKVEAEVMVEQLMIMAQYTAELYQELQVLERFEQDYERKRQEEDNSVATQRGESLAILKSDLKSQRKQVKYLKKKSLWSRSLDEVMEKFVDIVQYLLLEIHNTFGYADDQSSVKEFVGNHRTLGPAGLALHYANIIMQLDTLVARSGSIPPNTRDSFYQNLPPSIKSALHSKLQSFHVKELTVSEIKAEMEKTLQWLVPVATNTAKAHHGFGWVGEWASTGSDANKKSAAGQHDVVRIETLHHADKQQTEAYILEQVLWLQRLVIRSKVSVGGRGGIRHSSKSPNSAHLKSVNQKPENEPHNSSSLTIEDQKMLQKETEKKRIRWISKSQDFDYEKPKLIKHDRLSKSSGYSPKIRSRESTSIKRLPSIVSVIAFGIEKEKTLDMIDRVDVLV